LEKLWRHVREAGIACVIVLAREGKDGLRQAADPEDLVAGHPQVLGQHRPAELGVGQIQSRQGGVRGEEGGVECRDPDRGEVHVHNLVLTEGSLHGGS